MQKIFTLKSGTEVPVRFNGATVEYNVCDTFAEAEQKYGAANAIKIFQQAESLLIQKDVKDLANDDGVTLETLRGRPATFGERTKARELRQRDPNATPKSASSGKIKAVTAQAAVADEMIERLRAINPELAAEYEAKINAAKALAVGAAPSATPTDAAPSATKPAPRKGSNK